MTSVCNFKGIFAPQSLDEAVRLYEGWHCTSGTSSSRVNAADRRTEKVTTAFDDLRCSSDVDIAALKVNLEATKASTVDSVRQETTITELRRQSVIEKGSFGRLTSSNHPRGTPNYFHRTSLASLAVSLGNLAETA